MQRPPASWGYLTCYVAFNSVELLVLVICLSPCTSLCAIKLIIKSITLFLFFVFLNSTFLAKIHGIIKATIKINNENSLSTQEVSSHGSSNFKNSLNDEN